MNMIYKNWEMVPMTSMTPKEHYAFSCIVRRHFNNLEDALDYADSGYIMICPGKSGKMYMCYDAPMAPSAFDIDCGRFLSQDEIEAETEE